jgi:hypothetical protein
MIILDQNIHYHTSTLASDFLQKQISAACRLPQPTTVVLDCSRILTTDYSVVSTLAGAVSCAVMGAKETAVSLNLVIVNVRKNLQETLKKFQQLEADKEVKEGLVKFFRDVNEWIEQGLSINLLTTWHISFTKHPISDKI